MANLDFQIKNGLTVENTNVISNAGAWVGDTIPVTKGGTGVTTNTGTGSVVLSNTPTLVTPILGVATATSINKLTITAPSTSATLTIADTKTLTVNNTLTFTGTDSSSVAFGAGGTVTYAGTANAFTGANTFTNSTGQIFRNAATQDGIKIRGRAGGTGSYTVDLVPGTLTASRTVTFADGDTTLQAGTMAITGSTLAQFAATTSAQLAGVISDETGSGSLVFATSPTLVTPTLGTPASGTLTNCTGLPVAGISGLGANVATFLATPSSTNLLSAITDETGSGSLVFATSPALTTPSLSGETFSTTNNVTAGTNAQGQGVLTSDYNVITGAGSNPSGVTLPAATAGRRIIIINKGGNPVNVYPSSGDYIDALALNTPISLPFNYGMEFNASSATQWYSSFNYVTAGSAVSGNISGNAANVTGTVAVANGGTGITTTPSNGNLLIGNGSGYTLTNLTGTTNQVSVSNGSGSITLSLPQSIATASTPQFARLGVGGAADAGDLLCITAGSLTADYQIINGTATWNASGVTFKGLLFNITNTASAAGSLLADLQVGGTSKFKVDVAGAVTAASTVKASVPSYGVAGSSGLVPALNASGVLDSSATAQNTNQVDISAITSSTVNVQIGMTTASITVAAGRKVRASFSGHVKAANSATQIGAVLQVTDSAATPVSQAGQTVYAGPSDSYYPINVCTIFTIATAGLVTLALLGAAIYTPSNVTFAGKLCLEEI